MRRSKLATRLLRLGVCGWDDEIFCDRIGGLHYEPARRWKLARGGRSRGVGRLRPETARPGDE